MRCVRSWQDQSDRLLTALDIHVLMNARRWSITTLRASSGTSIRCRSVVMVDRTDITWYTWDIILWGISRVILEDIILLGISRGIPEDMILWGRIVPWEHWVLSGISYEHGSRDFPIQRPCCFVEPNDYHFTTYVL